jgi:hypothetical protein
MKLRIYQSDKGDCLLLESGGKNVLIDGGMAASFESHVRASLTKLRKLDLVCVSHIDDDHISGILRLLDDAMAWRIHKHQKSLGKKGNKLGKNAPGFPEPPAIGEIWHNGFREQIGENAGEIGDMFAAAAAVFTRLQSGTTDTQPRFEASAFYSNLAASVGQGLRLSRRIANGQLGIPLNTSFGGKLVRVEGANGAIGLGKGASLTVLAPFDADLGVLRGKWNEWLRENKEALTKLRNRAKIDEKDLGKDAAAAVGGPILELAAKIGDRKKVTAPNLASIMFLAEESGQGKKHSAVLTGDGHCDEVVRGLEKAGKLAANSGLHVSILKVPHHGSEFNSNPKFARRITADHYVFCGNGAHKNPDLEIVDLYLKSRLGSADERSANPQVNQKFQLWFNSSSKFPGGKAAHRAHMAKVEKLVGKWAGNHPDRFKATFFNDDFKEIAL